MNYELAKELKDAGYPEPNPNLSRGLWAAGDFKETGVYLPTLSELIEACGEGFYKLIKISAKEPFYAYNDVQDIVVAGSTPEEAVARLWLALNKK